jgi:molecular chaperone GrpE
MRAKNTKDSPEEMSASGSDRSPASGLQDEPTVIADSAKLQIELAEQKDHYLRLAADFENFRKRTRRDSKQVAAAEKDAFILELLPVLDNLERALASEYSPTSAPLHQGVAITLRQISQLLCRHGMEAVQDIGLPFNPHRHEAVSTRHDPDQPDQAVLEVTQHGYCRGDRVFRPAKVIVNVLDHLPGARHAG